MIGRKNKKGRESTPQARVNPPMPERRSSPPITERHPERQPEPQPAPRQPAQPAVRAKEPAPHGFANIGKSITVRGELTGNEDLMVDGTVEGKIVLQAHNLTIGPNAHVTAEVSAKSVSVVGHVIGNIHAAERIEISAGGTVEGDVAAPVVVLAEGARFKGAIDMLSGASPSPTPQSSWREPETTWQEPEATWQEPEAETPSMFQEAQDTSIPDDLVEDTPVEPKETSGKQSKGEKSGKKTAKSSDDNPKLAGMFDGFDPSNP